MAASFALSMVFWAVGRAVLWHGNCVVLLPGFSEKAQECGKEGLVVGFPTKGTSVVVVGGRWERGGKSNPRLTAALSNSSPATIDCTIERRGRATRIASEWVPCEVAC